MRCHASGRDAITAPGAKTAVVAGSWFRVLSCPKILAQLKEIMDDLVVILAATLIAVVALVINRSLPKE
jgi:hypothetical protein